MNLLVAWFRNNQRPIALTLVLLFLAWLVWQLSAVLLPFILGILLAWLLQPLLESIEGRLPCNGCLHQFKRVSIIIVIYLVTATILALLVYYAIAIIGRSVATLLVASPQLIPEALATLARGLDSFLTSLPPAARDQMNALLSQAGTRAGEVLVSFITAGFSRIGNSSNTILGFVAFPVFVFYLLKDWGRLREDFYGALPRWTLFHVRNVCSIIHNVVGRYLRGELILGFVVGFATYVLLTIVGVQYKMPLAVFGGIGEVIPLVGPWMSGIIGVLVVLATSPDKVLWVGFGYIAIQLLENNLLVPRIQGRQMNIHPAVVIVLTIVAGSRAGILGFILALPLTMTLVEIIKYVKSQRITRDSIIS